MFKGSRLLVGLGCLALLAGCKTAEDFRDERYGGVNQTIGTIENRVNIEPGRILSLNECKAFALENNLDIRVLDLKADVSSQRVVANMLEMLPDLTVGYDGTRRSNYAASTSTGVGGGSTGDSGNTRSSEKYENRFNIEIAFSVLDFGLSFLNAQQAQSRALIDLEMRRRAAQNLQLDVTRAYFKVAATQDAIDATQDFVSRCDDIYKMLDQLRASGEIDPFVLVDQRRKFFQMQNALERYRRNYQDACMELRALMGLYPTADIRVDTSILNQLADLSVPEVEKLEVIALAERPELYQLDIQNHITATEAQKTVLKMFPVVSLTTSMINTDNPFLMNQTWFEIGAKAAYNLLKLPQQIAYYKSIRKEMDENAMRILALSVGVMSQVRIAYANLADIRRQYELDKTHYRFLKEEVDMFQQQNDVTGSLNYLQLEVRRMEELQSRIDSLLSLGSYYVGYARLINAVGIDNLNPETVEHYLEEIQLAEARGQSEQNRLMAAATEFQHSTATYNGQPLQMNTIDQGSRQAYLEVIPASVAGDGTRAAM